MNAKGSLQGRLLRLVLGVVAVAWLVALAATWRDAQHELDELLDSHLAQAAALLVVQQSTSFGDEGRQADAPLLHRYAPKVAFQVFHEGRLAARSANAPAQPMVDAREHRQGGFSTVRLSGATWRVFAAHGAENDVQVYVGEQLDSRYAISLAVLRSALWPLAVVLPVLALALWWAIRTGLMPLQRLGDVLAQRRPAVLEPLSVQGLPKEMMPMVTALNSLFDRIAALIDSERRFTSDAAHELRTPIAAIRAQAQVALGEPDSMVRQQALLQTLAGCDRATHLVNQLLTLSRLESGTAPQLGPTDLAAVCRDVVGELAPAAISRHQQLEFDGAGQCQVSGNETLLRALVRNLVDNAVRYAGDGARIACRLAATNGRFTLSVDDSGPGLGIEELGQLGVRFSRKSGTAESGSGLGWSICERICRVHGYTLQAMRSTDLGGFRAEVSGQSKA
ncbi:ATP-binding protein [Massilia solisilvae]|uniref:histidine kinase n=1 Tax=Massilia solisilvae TaxID=1811225 RepID=A0ABT2BQS3_9BURK|nr:ATP-binding protein [Massilia solisilvae]MCS0610856.1 ATP-binding protein [Massilia solisilvae]